MRRMTVRLILIAVTIIQRHRVMRQRCLFVEKEGISFRLSASGRSG